MIFPHGWRNALALPKALAKRQSCHFLLFSRLSAEISNRFPWYCFLSQQSVTYTLVHEQTGTTGVPYWTTVIFPVFNGPQPKLTAHRLETLVIRILKDGIQFKHQFKMFNSFSSQSWIKERTLQNIPECKTEDVIALEIEVKGSTEPFQILLEPYAVIIPGEIFIGVNIRKRFKVSLLLTLLLSCALCHKIS